MAPISLPPYSEPDTYFCCMRLDFRVLLVLLPALALGACRTVGSSPGPRSVPVETSIDQLIHQEPVSVGLDEISRLSAGRNAHVQLRDGRRRDVTGLLARSDSVSYMVVPGDRLEWASRQHIASISLKRTNRWKGAWFGGRFGFLLATVVGTAAEYWAGARGRTLMWAVPVYGTIGIVLGTPVGAVAGVPEMFRYTGGTVVRPTPFLAGERE